MSVYKQLGPKGKEAYRKYENMVKDWLKGWHLKPTKEIITGVMQAIEANYYAKEGIQESFKKMIAYHKHFTATTENMKICKGDILDLAKVFQQDNVKRALRHYKDKPKMASAIASRIASISGETSQRKEIVKGNVNRLAACFSDARTSKLIREIYKKYGEKPFGREIYIDPPPAYIRLIRDISLYSRAIGVGVEAALRNAMKDLSEVESRIKKAIAEMKR